MTSGTESGHKYSCRLRARNLNPRALKRLFSLLIIHEFLALIFRLKKLAVNSHADEPNDIWWNCTTVLVRGCWLPGWYGFAHAHVTGQVVGWYPRVSLAIEIFVYVITVPYARTSIKLAKNEHSMSSTYIFPPISAGDLRVFKGADLISFMIKTHSKSSSCKSQNYIKKTWTITLPSNFFGQLTISCTVQVQPASNSHSARF